MYSNLFVNIILLIKYPSHDPIVIALVFVNLVFLIGLLIYIGKGKKTTESNLACFAIFVTIVLADIAFAQTSINKTVSKNENIVEDDPAPPTPPGEPVLEEKKDNSDLEETKELTKKDFRKFIFTLFNYRKLVKREEK